MLSMSWYDLSLPLSLFSCLLSQGDLWYFIDDGPLFDSLGAVIDHYMLFPDGLPTLLRFPVSPSGGSKTSNASKLVSSSISGVIIFVVIWPPSMRLDLGGLLSISYLLADVLCVWA